MRTENGQQVLHVCFATGLGEFEYYQATGNTALDVVRVNGQKRVIVPDGATMISLQEITKEEYDKVKEETNHG